MILNCILFFVYLLHSIYDLIFAYALFLLNLSSCKAIQNTQKYT